MKSFSELDPGQRMRRVGAMLLTVLFLVLAVFLVIGWLVGDTTNNLEENQPTAPPSTSGP